MTKKFEDYLFSTDNTNHKVLKYSEYRKGSNEYGKLVQDLMMLLRLKWDENKETDNIILTKKDIKNFDYNKLISFLSDNMIMRKLGISFDVEFLPNKDIKITNFLNKESRPWEKFNDL